MIVFVSIGRCIVRALMTVTVPVAYVPILPMVSQQEIH